MASSIKKLAVIGAGQMGTGIAQIAATNAKIPTVYLLDVNQDQLLKQLSFIGVQLLSNPNANWTYLDKNLSKDVSKGRMTEDEKFSAVKRLITTSNMAELGDCDFIIEAAPENEQLKTSIFSQLSKVLNPSKEPIIASNTSSISITKLAASYKNPANFVGMHFMNPVPVMKLIELICGKQTSEHTLSVTKNLAGVMGKTTTTSADVPGFIANRLLMPYLNEAMFALYEVKVHSYRNKLALLVGNRHQR